MRENCTYSLSGGQWPARKRATSDPTGPMLDVGLPLHLSFEFDALYRRVGFTSEFNPPLYSANTRERANDWEFPMLLKRRFMAARSGPFLGVGYSPRIVRGTDISSGTFLQGLGTIVFFSNQSSSTNYPVTHGVVVSGGLNLNFAHLRLSPQIRYVHWNEPFLYDSGPDIFQPLASKQNEVFVLVGLSWHRAGK